MGFGDISATNTSEQVFLIVAMLTGSLILAKIIAEVHRKAENMRENTSLFLPANIQGLVALHRFKT